MEIVVFLLFLFAVLLIVVVPTILAVVFWIWTIQDVVANEPPRGNDRMVWIAVVVFMGLPGALVYYFARRQQRIDRYGH